jgi:hypothetical protein
MLVVVDGSNIDLFLQQSSFESMSRQIAEHLAGKTVTRGP